VTTVWSCRHCGKSYKSPKRRTRGLCWHCYQPLAVRELYAPESIFCRQGSGVRVSGRPPLPEPTRALPGTPEKVAVLTERAGLGQALWHPLDAAREKRRTG